MTRWWQDWRAVAAAMLIATVPLWFVQLPPLIDLLGHMGRYRVQTGLADSAALQANWDFHWQLIGNLGADVLMEGLARLFGVERGAVVLAAAIPALMIWGMARLARASHGSLPPTVWAAFPLAMSYPWQYGLVNFWLGIAVALHAAASFGHPPDREEGRWTPAFAQASKLAVVALLLWTVHIFSWAVFAVLLGCRAIADRPLRDWPRVALPLWPLAAPAVLMLLLRYGQSGAAAQTLGWWQFGYKLHALLWTLRDQVQILDIACLLVAMLLIGAGFSFRVFRVDRGLMLAAGVLLAMLAIIPYQLFGSAYADARLWPVVLIVALLAIRPAEEQSRLAGRIAVAAMLVLVVRTGVTTWGFQRYDRDFARHLRALEHVPVGARIAVFVEFPCKVPWRRPRLEHLDGIAIVRRDAFTNGQWDVPGAQLLTPKGAIGTRYNSDPSQLVMGCGDLRPALARRIAAFPRDRFQFVWAIGYRPATLPTYPGLKPVFADEATILYRIVR